MKPLRALALALSACFSPDLPDTSFSCGPAEPRCPDGFACGADGCCHRLGAPITACTDGGVADGGDRDGSRPDR